MYSSVLQSIVHYFISSVFFFQNNPKNLDPSCKMDLDLWDCLGKVNNYILQQNFVGLIYVFLVILETGKPRHLVK